jgi:hypothetical protein
MGLKCVFEILKVIFLNYTKIQENVLQQASIKKLKNTNSSF